MIFLFTGDFCVTNCFKGPIEISDEIIHLFESSDYNVINLECPITKEVLKNRINKTGPNLNGRTDSFSILSRVKAGLVTIANNHILDYGPTGLEDTLRGLKKNSIQFVGAGNSINEAKKALYFKRNGLKISFLNFAENEWSSAGDKKPGANPLDIISNVNQIKEEKKKADILIVIVHGGHEYYHLPSPRMVKQYRFYAENGASFIVGHHTHCIGGYEIHKGVPIFYSLGNFIFTLQSKFEDWYTGLILQVDVKDNLEIHFNLVPIEQSNDNFALTLTTGDKEKRIKNDIEKYRAIISDDFALKEAWRKFLDEKENQYLNIYSPVNFFKNRYIKSILRKSKLDKCFIKNHHYRQILNNIRCEAHLDASRGVIERYLD